MIPTLEKPMSIPSPKPFGVSHDAFTNKGSKGRNTAAFRRRHEEIFGPHKPSPGHTTIKYVNGKRVEIKNPSTNGPVIHSDPRLISGVRPPL